MRMFDFERFWNFFCLTLLLIFVLGIASFSPSFTTFMKRTDAELLLVQLDNPVYAIQLDASRRVRDGLLPLMYPTVDYDPENTVIYDRIIDRLKHMLVFAKTNEEKVLVLNAWGVVPGCAYSRAFELANQSLQSDDVNLLNAAIPMARGDRSVVGNKLIDIANRHPECQLAVLTYFHRIFVQKGFPWGYSPDNDVLELAGRLRTSLDLRVSIEALELIRLREERS